MIYPVILSGGAGTRLWPKSRTAMPKQLLPLTSEHSLFQEAVLRLEGLADTAAPTVICNNEHRFLIAEQLLELDVTPASIMLEPVARNTGPAVTLAALHLARQAPDGLMLVLPADHVIDDVPGFHAAIRVAGRCASAGRLITFGVVPQTPETGYGYIKRGEALDDEETAFSVSRFVEKPEAAVARGYLEAGDYLWNSGMFMFQASAFLEEMQRFQPEIIEACTQSLEESYSDLDFLRLGVAPLRACPSLALDYAVMEKTSRAAVVPVDIGWNDVGSWTALWERQPKDSDGNATQGQVVLHGAGNCYVTAEERLVAAVGVQDLIIVETADAVLVVHRDHAQDVKVVVERLRREGRTEHEIHSKVYRPWGSYEGMDRGDRFQVKRLIVKPGARLSLQMHHHRAEHWVVVSGTAEVTVGDEVRLLAENESIYIPLGSNHRLHNPGRIPLHLIEVQSGPYLGEDDIVRFEDTYGRDNNDGKAV